MISAPKRCPRCGLMTPGESQQCDCGYDFITRRTTASYAGPPLSSSRRADINDEARQNMFVGGIACLFGIGVTVLTYSIAAHGGIYVVSSGAILFGGLKFLKGVFQYLSSKT